MFQAEKKVADYILKHPEEVVELNIAELAKRSETSDATVIRMCRHVGYSGFYQMKISLASELLGKQKKNVQSEQGSLKEFFDKVSRDIREAAEKMDQDIVKRCVNLLAEAETVYTELRGGIPGRDCRRFCASDLQEFWECEETSCV